MSLPSGLDAQIGFAEESSYGTIATPDTFYEFVSESLKRQNERIESNSLRAGRQTLGVNDWQGGRIGVEGDIEIAHPDRGAALLWKHALGAVSTTQPDVGNAPTVYQHVATVDDLSGRSLTCQVGRPDVSGTVHPFTYSGIKIPEWELSVEVDGSLMLTLTCDGYDETTSEPLEAASYITGLGPLYWVGGTITIAGSTYDTSSFTLSGSNALKTDRYFIRGAGSNKKKEPLVGDGFKEWTGEIESDFIDLAAYNRFVNDETAKITAKFEGDTIEDAFKFTVLVECEVCRFDGETPNVSGPESLENTIPFKVLDDGATSPVKVTITDNQATV